MRTRSRRRSVASWLAKALVIVGLPIALVTAQPAGAATAGPVISYRGAGPVLGTPARTVDAAPGLGTSVALGAGKTVVRVSDRAGVPTTGGPASASAATTGLSVSGNQILKEGQVFGREGLS